MKIPSGLIWRKLIFDISQVSIHKHDSPALTAHQENLGKKIEAARKKLKEASDNASEDKKLCNRTSSALDVLYTQKDMARLIKVISDLGKKLAQLELNERKAAGLKRNTCHEHMCAPNIHNFFLRTYYSY